LTTVAKIWRNSTTVAIFLKKIFTICLRGPKVYIKSIKKIWRNLTTVAISTMRGST
jgi:hypothetical protein